MGGVLAWAILWGLAPASARAYRTFADDAEVGYPARWSSTEVAWQLGAAPAGVDASAWESASRGAFEAWAASGCGPIGLVTASSGGEAVGGDGVNTITALTSGWAARGYPERAAFTEVVLRVEPDGVVGIVEADIYLNAAAYRFEAGGEGSVDVGEVLLHEVGHGLGLLHSCGDAGAPACEGAWFAASVMNPTYGGDARGALGADDVVGICALYTPIGCSEPGGCRLSCDDATPCAEGVCSVAGASAGMCVAPQAPGTECDRGEDCDTGLCVTSASRGSYCTVACRSDAECAADEACSTFGSRSVCAPRVSSCAAAPSGPPGAPIFGTLALVATLLLLRRRTPK